MNIRSAYWLDEGVLVVVGCHVCRRQLLLLEPQTRSSGRRRRSLRRCRGVVLPCGGRVEWRTEAPPPGRRAEREQADFPVART